MIVQIFRETRPTAGTNILQDNIDQIDNDNTLRSMFSGDSFPTNPAPVVGQPCYRTDLKKLFIYTTDGWVEIMGKPIYDPRSVSADVFHMDNMTEGINTKIMTSAERDKLANATVGPANSIDGGIAVFDGTTGKAIKDSGKKLSDVLLDVSQSNNRTWDVIIEDQKSSGTDGGKFNSGAWITRDLNTLVYNHDSLASLSNNRFTLPAGTYCIDWDAPAFDVDVHKTLLYNYTKSSIVAYGTSERSSASTVSAQTRSFGTSIITIDQQTQFEIRHRCSNTQSDSGLGRAASFGTEIYTRVRIKKIV